MVESRTYDGFGNLIAGSRSDRYGRVGREWDAELGLQYNRARMYDPSSGRWLSEDPAGFAAGDANLHRYVGNDAAGATDPSGLADPDLPISRIYRTPEYHKLDAGAKDAADQRNTFFESVFKKHQNAEAAKFTSDKERRLILARAFDPATLKELARFKSIYNKLDAIPYANRTTEQHDTHEMLRRFYYRMENIGYNSNGIYLQYLNLDILKTPDPTIRSAPGAAPEERNFFTPFAQVAHSTLEGDLSPLLQFAIGTIDPSNGPFAVDSRITNPGYIIGFMYYPDESLWGGNPYIDIRNIYNNIIFAFATEAAGFVGPAAFAPAARLAIRPSAGMVYPRVGAPAAETLFAKMDRINHFPHPKLEAYIEWYKNHYAREMLPENVEDVIAAIKAGGYQVQRGPWAFNQGKLVNVPDQTRKWIAYEEWYHARVGNEGFLKDEIAALKKALPERVFPPGYKGKFGKEARPGRAAEEIAIKEYILKNHANLLDDADRFFLENQIKVMRVWGVYYGY